VLVVLVAGLTLLACVPDPVEKEWLGEVSDEFQITDDAVVQHDPVFYNTENYDSIEEAQIAYHDGTSIYLHDIASKSTETLYQAPSGYTITAMCALSNKDTDELHDLVFALEGNGESVVMRETSDIYTELYRDYGVTIENIQADYVEFLDKFFLFCERDGQIQVYQEGVLVDTFEGTEPGTNDCDFCIYVGEYEGESYIYEYAYLPQDGGIHTRYYSNGSSIGHPNKFRRTYYYYLCFATDIEGDIDIWVEERGHGHKVCEAEGDEQELCGWSRYITFTRTINGQTDIFIIRASRS
jgi:hypothetical protein